MDTLREFAEAPGAFGYAQLERAVAFARRHWLFLLIFTAGFLLRLVVTVTYRPGLELYGDSYDYLVKANTLVPGPWNPAGYPLFLRVLSVTGTLGVVPLVQHLLGLGIGVAVYALLLRLGIRRPLAALGAVPVLLDAYQVDIEQFVLAETLTEALLVAATLLLLWRRRTGPAVGAAVGALIALAIITRSAVIPVLAVVGLYLLIRRHWRAVGTFVLGAAAVIVPYGLWNFHYYGSFGVTDYSGYFLYGRVATFATCNYPLSADERLLCPRQPVDQRPYNQDYYVWLKGTPLQRAPLGSLAQRNLVAERFSEKVILQQPLDYAKVVFDDTWHYFAPGRSVAPNANVADFVRWQFPGPHLNGNAGIRINGHLDQYHIYFANFGFNDRPVLPSPDFGFLGLLRTYQSFAYMQGPVLLACLVGALIVGLRRRRSDPDRAPARSAALVLALAGLAMLVLPSLTTGFSYRYELLVYTFLPPAGVIAADFALDSLGRRAARRRELAEQGVAAPGLGELRLPLLRRSNGSGDHGDVRAKVDQGGR
ncbi:MAG: hypothetical protein J2P57_07950 [Acidimicrobiaceae bacterium]|nr:hypothetical protein [Acidimicrobiaceae bacterium]